MEDPTAPDWSRCRRVAAIHAHSASVKCVSGGRWPAAHPGESGRMRGDSGTTVDGFATAGMDGAARVWTLDGTSSSGFRCVAAFGDHTAGVRAVAMPPPRGTGRDRASSSSSSSSGIPRTAPEMLAATGSYDRTARLWHASRAAPPVPPLANGHGDYVLCVSFGPDARTLVTGGADGRICVWDCDDAAAGNPAPAACLRPGSNAAVRSVDASLPPPSEDEPGDVLSMTGGEDGTLRVFSHASNGGAVCEVVFAGHGGAVTCLALCRGEERGWGSPPRARKEEGSGTRRIRIAAGHDGGVLSVHDAALTSGPPGDGNAPGTVRASAKVREVFVGRVHANGAARATLLLRPDARTVASASEDRTVRLWNMQKGNCLCVLVGARCTVESVSFSALGDLLYAGLADGHVWVYLEEGGEEDDVASGDGVERVIESRLALAMEALRDPKDPRASSTSESERCAAAPRRRLAGSRTRTRRWSRTRSGCYPGWTVRTWRWWVRWREGL